MDYLSLLKLIDDTDQTEYEDDFENTQKSQLQGISQPEPQDEAIDNPAYETPDEDAAEGEDEEINDEEMIEIAENCLIKIANALIQNNVSIKELFA